MNSVFCYMPELTCQMRGFWNVLMRIERRYIIIAYTRGVNILHKPPPRILAEYAPYHSMAWNIWQRSNITQQREAITAPNPKSLTHAGAFHAETSTPIRNKVMMHIGPNLSSLLPIIGKCLWMHRKSCMWSPGIPRSGCVRLITANPCIQKVSQSRKYDPVEICHL